MKKKKINHFGRLPNEEREKGQITPVLAKSPRGCVAARAGRLERQIQGRGCAE